MTDIRWPLAPLLAATRLNHPELADLLNVARSRIYDAERQGLSDLTADRYACACGLHPSCVWPTWFDPYVDDITNLFARISNETRAA